MKSSIFNIVVRNIDDILVYNSLSGALLAFEKKYFDVIQNAFLSGSLDNIPKDFISVLKDGGFFVDDDNDELDRIRILTQRRINWFDSWHFSIMLNQACNFMCDYCFQPRKNLFMSVLVGSKVLKMIEGITHQTKRISVDWYGGEPTLSFNFLKKLNDAIAILCEKAQIEYIVSMTTNGYLLDDDILKYLKSFQMSHLQITLDAPRENHNRTRILKNGSPTFNAILQNIKKAVGYGIHVLVRVNVTNRNLKESYTIYNALERTGLKNKVEVSIRPVISSESNSCEGSCPEAVRFGKKMLSHYYEAAKNGWIVLPFVDNLQSMGYCIADYPTHAIIDPRGNIYKCGESFSDKENMGKISRDGYLRWDKRKFDAFIERDPLIFPECRICKILPICMGGCHMLRFWKNRISCNEFRHDLGLFVKILYYNQINLDQFARKEKVLA